MQAGLHEEVIIAASITSLPSDAAGRIVLTGSHGGLFTGRVAAAHRLGGVVFHDAGSGLDEAGTEGVRFLAGLGIPAAAVGHESARIGDPMDMLGRGVISTVNGPAEAFGIRPGDAVEVALTVLLSRPRTAVADIAPPSESRFTIPGAGRPGRSCSPTQRRSSTRAMRAPSWSLDRTEGSSAATLGSQSGGLLRSGLQRRRGWGR